MKGKPYRRLWLAVMAITLLSVAQCGWSLLSGRSHNFAQKRHYCEGLECSGDADCGSKCICKPLSSDSKRTCVSR